MIVSEVDTDDVFCFVVDAEVTTMEARDCVGHLAGRRR